MFNMWKLYSACKPGKKCCAHAVPRRLGEGEEEGGLDKNSFFTILLVTLKKVEGPVLEEAKDRAIRRIADFATLRKAPMVREKQRNVSSIYGYELFKEAW